MSYHIINTRNPEHLLKRGRYGSKHPLSIGWLYVLWSNMPEPSKRLSKAQWRKKRAKRNAAELSRRKNRR